MNCDFVALPNLNIKICSCRCVQMYSGIIEVPAPSQSKEFGLNADSDLANRMLVNVLPSASLPELLRNPRHVPPTVFGW